MATSSFFYGGSSAPDQNTVDELIDALNSKVAAADEDRVAAELAASQAQAAAANAELAEDNTAGLAAQAQTTLTAAEAAVAAANASVAGTATNATTATTKAAEAASSATAADASADAALVSELAAGVSAAAAAASASTASTQASAAGTSATNAASSASAAAGSASTATTQATNASTSATAAAGSASAASTSATSAASSASAASSSATSASSSATSASGSATTATTKASEATASASAAATSASNATTSATSASGSATTATTQATNASNSATSAATSASSASTSATNAANSATAAGTSATNAASSASAASTSASQAATSASNAASSASAASGSASTASTAATAAQAAQTAAEAVYDNFDDRYLGAKASAPSVDNDGNALVTGALYFNSTLGQMSAWNGSSWGAIGSNPDSVLGPASSTDNAIARFDGTTGKLVQNSLVAVDDSGNLSTAGGVVGGYLAPAGMPNIGSWNKFYHDGSNGYSFKTYAVNMLSLNGQFRSVTTSSDSYYGWTNSSDQGDNGYGSAAGVHDLRLFRDAAAILAQRNGTNPQTFRVYNTYTDGSNYERGFLKWNTNVLEIGAEAAGTGSLRDVHLKGTNIRVSNLSGLFEIERIGSGVKVQYYMSGPQQVAHASDVGIGWSSGTTATGTNDTGLSRDSAAVVKITNGSSGLGSLKAANIDFTGNLTVNGSPFSAGAKGGGTDAVFYENDQAVTTNYTIGSGKNAGTFGPITINSGVSVTVPSGSIWTVI